MMLFSYTALDKQGNETQGSLEAEDKRDATGQLRTQGLFVLELTLASEQLTLAEKSEVALLLSQLGWITNNQKIFFFRQMALMLKSGLALSESLDMISGIVSGKLSLVLEQMSNHVKNGGSFSDAVLEAEIFPAMAEHMIRSAEATGELDLVMGRIADDMGRKAEMKRQMTSAMLYPGITMLIALAMGYFMVTKVIPKFAKIFENSGKRLPEETQRLVDISNFINSNGYIIMACLAVLFALFKFIYSRPLGRYNIDRAILWIPVFGKIVKLGAMAQIGWGLAMLLRSGLTLVEALQIVEKLIPNKVISTAVADAREKVLSGRDLGSSLNSPYIEPLVIQLASVGERSGGMTHIMHEAGCFYEDSLKSLSKTLANLVEPAAILVIGGMVMMVYIGFFKAMMGTTG